MSEDRSDCVDNFEGEAAFVVSGAVVGVGAVVQIAGKALIKCLDGKEEEGNLRAKK
jgi:hypothetical protein